MMTSKSIRLLVGAMLFCAAPAAGQRDARDLQVKHRNDCRLAAQVLTTGHPHTKRAWALQQISGCEGEGPAALATVWQTLTDGSEIDALVTSSLRLKDVRLYQQLRATATDRSRPAAVRAAAMLVLTRYTDPHNAIWLTDLVPPDSIARIPLVGGSSTGYYPLDGEQPLSAPIAESVLALLQSIAAARTVEAPEVWYAAAVLARRLSTDIQYGRAQ